MSDLYPNLFRPIRLGNVTIRNRILSSAHGTLFCENNEPSERLLRYHLDRAKGGVGLIVIEAVRVHPTTVSHARQPIGYEARVIPAFRRLADALHAEGAAIFAQILHQGREVIIATRAGETGTELASVVSAGLRARLGQKRVRTLPFHTVVRVEGRNVVLREEFTGFEAVLEEVDTVLYAGPHQSENDLLNVLQGRVAEVVAAGDCVAPRRALEAMREGHAAGRAL